VAARPQVSIFNQTLFNFSVLRSRHQHLYQHQHLPHPQHIFPPTRVHHSAILTNSQFATSVFFNHTPPLCQPIFLRALPLLRRDRMPTDRAAAAEEVTGPDKVDLLMAHSPFVGPPRHHSATLRRHPSRARMLSPNHPRLNQRAPVRHGTARSTSWTCTGLSEPPTIRHGYTCRAGIPAT